MQLYTLIGATSINSVDNLTIFNFEIISSTRFFFIATITAFLGTDLSLSKSDQSHMTSFRLKGIWFWASNFIVCFNLSSFIWRSFTNLTKTDWPFTDIFTDFDFILFSDNNSEISWLVILSLSSFISLGISFMPILVSIMLSFSFLSSTNFIKCAPISKAIELALNLAIYLVLPIITLSFLISSSVYSRQPLRAFRLAAGNSFLFSYLIRVCFDMPRS